MTLVEKIETSCLNKWGLWDLGGGGGRRNAVSQKETFYRKK